MQVILKENVSNLGFVGDIVNVRDGYARNYLIPNKKALPADSGNIKNFAHIKRQIEVKKTQKKSEASELKTRLEALKISVSHAAEGEKLFGSVTVTELHSQLKQAGFDIDRKLIRLEAPIKTLGEHEVEIKLHQEVSATLKVTVEKSEQAHA